MTAFNWVGLGQNIIRFLANGVTSLIQVIPELFRNFVNNAASIVGNFGWGSLGRAIMTALGNGVSSLASLLPNLARSIIFNMKDFFLRGGWDSIGRNIITGIISGIASAAGALFDSLANLASSALNAAKNALGIHSPSALFRDEIGRQIPAGMALGIEKNMGLVDGALSDMNSTAFGVVQNAVRGWSFDGTARAPQTNSYTIQMTVNAAEGQSVREVADAVMERLQWAIDRKEAAFV